ncbi:MAG TPA: hypothetical protein VD886_17810 [Herpetosiphonaceae bacterium]|nr:hypothetical protein [Herpetosiphonaceae bacterium]
MRRPIVIEVQPGVFVSYHQLCAQVWTLPRHRVGRPHAPLRLPSCRN